MNYIGADCHSSSIEFAVVNETGKLSKRGTVNTSESEFIEFIKSVKKPRRIYIEESELAGWLLEVCNTHSEDLIITDPKTNLLISSSGQKNDKVDSFKLAHLARGNYVKGIYHPTGERRRFKELVFAYHDTVKSGIRLKNKIKAKFRQNGVKCKNTQTIYDIKHRKEWKARLPDHPLVRAVIDDLWKQHDLGEKVKARLEKMIKNESKKYPEIKRFQELPGIGPIHAATISAIIETPFRFKNKRKLWKYAGFGIVRKGSGEVVYCESLSVEYNRQLKCTVNQAVEAALGSKDNQFRKQYYRLILEKGTSTSRAKLTIARSMLSVIYGMWKNGEAYDPKRIERKNNNI